ncbi:ATP-grasp domain-containing protein [Bacillus infantis]|uniref:ATP-grasp domain-containing protein n=1 Tax=Bacillus infantis TaxID=324767 RepID=A0A5D4SAF3_9BACI|nr:ATP-grasp domain-containing protein [Bacillus infantis]
MERVCFLQTFRSKLEESLLGESSSTNFIWLGNFETEAFWKDKDSLSLPSFTQDKSQNLINDLGELMLLLADQSDMVLLNNLPDLDFLQYLKNLGLKLPTILYNGNSQDKSLTQCFLDNSKNLQRLKQWAAENPSFLVPHGTSDLEERLSEITGIPLALPSANICSKVNSKIYSRKICDKYNIRQPKGKVILSLKELSDSYYNLCQSGHSPSFIVKEANGVSGKGIIKINDDKQFKQVYRILESSSIKKQMNALDLIIEEWIEKEADLHYQFLIYRTGKVEMINILPSIVNNGVHTGHIHPHSFSDEVVNKIEQTATLIGKELYENGYYGVVGVDGLIDKEGILYPCLEVNARFNMSTYHNKVLNEVLPNNVTTLEKSVHFKYKGYLSFHTFNTLVSDLLFYKGSRAGIMINTFASVNSNISETKSSLRRLYITVIGESYQDCIKLESQFKTRLDTFE